MTATFTSDIDTMSVRPEKLGALIRLLMAIAAAPHFGGTILNDEFVNFALYGIAGRPSPDDPAGAARRKD